MNVRRVVVLLIGIIVGFAGGSISQPELNPTEREVADTVLAHVDAWNAHDAERLSALCDEEFDRISARAFVINGREEFRAYYEDFFAGAPDGVERTLDYEIFSVRLITPDVAIVDARYVMTGAPTNPPRTVRGLNTTVLVKKNGRWLYAALRQSVPITPENLDRRVPLDR